MNTSKQINVMVALVFAAVIATGAYWMWDPGRASEAKDTQLERTVDRGAYLFAQNCRACHGNSGEGGAASNRLKLAPPLNRPDLQGKDAKTGQVDRQTKEQQFKFVANTIICGRIGKSMPTWGQAQGGTLNEEQVRQLATLITEGTGWEKANELAVDGDHEFHITGDKSAGIKLDQALDASAMTVYLTSVGPLAKGSRIQIEDEIMNITAVNGADFSVPTLRSTVFVERKVGTTKAAAHSAGTEVLVVPVPPDPAPITQPACGQLMPAVQPTPSGPVTASTELKIVAVGIQFDTDKLLGVANQPLKVTFDNQDAGIPHNIHFFKGADATGESIAASPIEAGPIVQTLDLPALPAGDYYFQCDVHPNMAGTLTTTEGGAAPAGGATPAAGTPAASATASATATPAATTTPSAGTTPSAPSGAVTELQIAAQNILFDKTKLTAPADQAIKITLDNKDGGIPHNIHVYKGKDASGESVGSTPIEAGPVVQTLELPPLAAGDYFFVCEVHPTTMAGTLTVGGP